MKSIAAGLALMVLIAVIAAFGLNSEFSQSSGERFTSPANVRLGE